ncbi:MAG: PAS domain S-box protein [Nitrospirota bacterium]|nr:MAG: PAS domain S-box protein [Nitrospirota bacterium]
MSDEKKTKKELIAELKKLRRKVSSIEKQKDRPLSPSRPHSMPPSLISKICDQSPSMVFINAKGKIVYVNRRCTEIMGYSKKEFYSPDFDFLDLIAPDHLNGIKANFKKHMKGEDVPPYEYAVITKKGKRIETIITTKLIDYEGQRAILGIVTDISKRKKAEIVLQESEEKFRHIFENSPLGISHFDMKGKIVDCNKALIKMLGSSKKKVIGFDAMKKFKEKEQKAALNSALSGRVGVYEGMYKSLTGTRSLYMKTVYGPIFNKAKEITGCIAITEDITEKKLVEKELREKDALHSLMLSSLPIAYYIAQPFDKFGGTWVSNQIDRICGFKPKDFSKDIDLWSKRLHPDDRDRTLKEFSQITKHDAVKLEYRWKAKNGTYKWFLDNAVLIRDEKGSPREVVGTWQDITAIKSNEKRLEALFDSATDAIFIIDMKGNFIDLNRTAHERLGYSKEEMLSMHISELDSPEFSSRVPERLEKIIKDDQVIFESAHLRKDGTVMPVEVNSRLMDYDGQKVFFSVIRDITKRKLAEEEVRDAYSSLEREKARTEAIVAAMGDGISIQSTDYKILYQNDVHKGLIGDHEGKLCYEAYELRKETCEGCPVASAFHDGRVHTTVRNVDFDDGRHYFEITASPLKDSSGRPIAGIEIVRDITGRKRLEDDLRESKDRFQSLVESTSDWIWEINEQGQYTYCSPRVNDILGFTPEELIGKTPFDLMPEDEAIRVSGILKDILAKKAPISGLENINLHKNGNRLVLETSGLPILDSTGTLKGYRGIDRDITARKHTEEMLRQREQTYRSLIESTSAIAWDFDLADMRFLYVSPQAERITGYHPAKWTDFNFWANMIAPEDREWVPRHCAKETDAGRDHEMEYRIIAANGDRKWLREIVSVIKDGDKAVKLRGFMFDITERKDLEERLRTSRNLESLGILAGGIAHDFNNLLTSILGNISLARSMTDEVKISARLNIAENASLRAKDLTQQLLTFSKGGAPVKRSTRITDIITDSANFALSGSNIQRVFDIGSDIWPVTVDEGQISQVIHNLTINAREAMPQGGTLTIKVANMEMTSNNNLPVPDGEYVMISVIDQGKGISNEHISKVFDPYFSTKEMGIQKGMGLGLTICYSIVKNHDGLITVESELNKGTSFHIFLPATKEDVTGDEVTFPAGVIDTSGSGKVLFMDDEEIVRDVALSMLEQLGYEAVPAKNGEEAIKIYRDAINKDKPFSAVILDLTIAGGMGGEKAVKGILELDPDARVLISSGYTNDPVIASYEEYGFKGFVIKPYKIEDLGILLKDIISG